MEIKREMRIRYGFVLTFIIVGTALMAFGIGPDEFLGFPSLGLWLVFAGIVGLMAITLRHIVWRKRVIDERMLLAASKASRIAFMAFFLFAFVVMIIDGIHPIAVPYHQMMSYMVCSVMVVYVASYRLMLSHM